MTGLSLEAPDDPAADAHRWRRKFEDRTIVVQRVRNLPQAEAERAAFEIVLVEFLNATHPDTDPSRCAWCGKPETPADVLLPIGVGARHAWLHDRCWAPWRERRRTEAIATLAGRGSRSRAREGNRWNRKTPMTDLVRYEAARTALAAAASVDEVKDVLDIGVAMQIYARQAKDCELIDKATEIRLRAERRLGEMIIAQKKTVGLAKGAAGIRQVGECGS